MGRSPRSTDATGLKRLPRTSVGARRIGSGIAESSRSHDFGVPATSTCGSSGVLAATRHPVQTPARRCHRGVPSRRVDAVVSQPRSTPPSPQLDVAGTPGEGLPRRLRDTDDRPACSDKMCGAPSGALQRPSIVVRGWGYTAAARRRAATAAGGGEQPLPLEREQAATRRGPANAWLAPAGFGVVTHHVEHLLGHVLGVIADPFQALECKHGVERRLEELVVLHHE